MNQPRLAPAPQLNRLVYREPVLGRDYWVLDDALPDPMAVRERALARQDWVLGAPHRPESWPGMRLQPGLLDEELAPLVLYLSPGIPEHAGTSFFRVCHPDGQLGGNCVPSRFANLVEAFGTRFVPPGLFVPDVAVDARFNRLLVYRADLIHSASAYFGEAPQDRRMTAVFFWMAR